MAWIESHQDLAYHPKVMRLANILGVSKPAAIGHLHLFWYWCLSYADDGDITDFEPYEIADGAQWPGDAVLFLDGLEDAGWVDVSDGGSEVHDWYEYAGKLVERRRADAERKRIGRRTDVQRTSNGQGKSGLKPHETSNGRPTDDRKDGVRTNQPNQPTQPNPTAVDEFNNQRALKEAQQNPKVGNAPAYARVSAADPQFRKESERLFTHKNCSRCKGKGFYDSDYAPGAGVRKIMCEEPV